MYTANSAVCGDFASAPGLPLRGERLCIISQESKAEKR